MKFHLGLFSMILCAFVWPTQAQGPDSTYVRIYHVIQEADSLVEGGQEKRAVEKYRQADQQLREFRENNPRWHSNIVNYRLNYLQSRLNKLAPEEVAPAEGEGQVEAGASGDEPAPPSTPDALDQQLRDLQAQIQQLKNQNNLLEQKLKEAWTAQPATADPKELENARRQIQELQKERDLYQVALDRSRQALPSAEETSLLEQERRILAEVRQQLATQTERADSLEQENTLLKSEISGLKANSNISPVPDSDLSRQLASATAALEDLRATNTALRTRIILLDTQVADMMKAATRPTSENADAMAAELKTLRSQLKSVTREKDRLEKQLVTVTKRLQDSGDESDLQKEIRETEAKLQVLEATAVPFSAEELALVKHGDSVDLSLATDQTPVERKPAELPPGAGPIMAQAERAIQNGQFDAAEEMLRDILRQDENNVITLAKLSAVLLEKKNEAEAGQLLQRATTVDPMDPASNYLLGILRYQQEKYDEAFNALSLSSRVNPDKPETQYFLGMTLLQKGNREPAETAFRKAIQLRPGWGMAHYELALVYVTQDPPYKELAEWHYQKAISGGVPRNFDLEKKIEDAPSK